MVSEYHIWQNFSVGKTFRLQNAYGHLLDNFHSSMHACILCIYVLILIMPINKAIDYRGALQKLWEFKVVCD